MGQCSSSSEEYKRSKEIDSFLNEDKNKHKGEVKLLLLGPGESGKSTIFKQLRIIQDNGGFSEEELKSYRYIVYGNCVTQMKVLVNAAAKLSFELDSDENRKRAEHLLKVPSGGDAWSSELGDDIKNLWKDSGIQKTYASRDRYFQLNDSSAYFFESIDRFLVPNYVPTVDDVLRARVRSTGIEEAEFKFEGVAIRIVDVGGQRSERRKWIHCFDLVTAVIFCVSLSEYDQNLREDDTQNRMIESLMLYDEVCNSRWFRNIPIVLFLNKVDLFKEKIKQVDLKLCFPSYTGGADFEKASEFIKSRFEDRDQSPHMVYVHFTCAIDTDNISFVFKCVRESILKKILNDVIL